jgi:transposase
MKKKHLQTIGIDISKGTFHACDSKLVKEYPNKPDGFKSFIQTIGKNTLCIMESTGIYHQALATYLFEQGIQVCVENPLVIRRFIQMKLQKSKTDETDARMIQQFGEEQPIIPWSPFPQCIQKCRYLLSAIELFARQGAALKSKVKEYEAIYDDHKRIPKQAVERQLYSLEQEIYDLRNEVETIIRKEYTSLYCNLQTIPGIGSKTAVLLIVLTAGFNRFPHAKHLISYIGFAPIMRSSGTSVRGRTRVSKTGNKHLRNQLFMCSFTASKVNPGCKLLFDRLVAKGKSKKLALIAVSAKLIKQSFAIAKSGKPFDPQFQERNTPCLQQGLV